MFFFVIESHVAVSETLCALEIAGYCCCPHGVTFLSEELLQIKIVETSGRQVTNVETRPGGTIGSLVICLLTRLACVGVHGNYLLHSSVVDLSLSVEVASRLAQLLLSLLRELGLVRALVGEN